MKPKEQELVQTLLEQENRERQLFTNAVKLVVILSAIAMVALILFKPGQYGSVASDVLITAVFFFGGSVVTGFALLFAEVYASRKWREKLVQKLKKSASADNRRSIQQGIKRGGMFKFLEVLCFLFTNGAYVFLIIYSSYAI